MSLADRWYASAAFADTAALILLGVLTTIGIIWVTIRVGFPRRRIYCGMPVAAPLLTAPAGLSGNLELLRDGKPLNDPHILEVHLTSKSRRDIPSDDFDSQQPLILDVGAPIVEITKITSMPDTIPAPSVTPDGTALRVGPSLIGKRQKVIITVLADGPNPHFSYKKSLINVDMREEKPEEPALMVLNLQLLRQQVIAAIAAVAGVTASTIATASSGSLALAAGWLGLGLLTVTAMVVTWMTVTVVRSPVRRHSNSQRQG